VRQMGRHIAPATGATVMALMLGSLTADVRAQDPIPGSLHTSPFPGFASGAGKTILSPIGSGGDGVNAIALQPDGKIVMAGACNGGVLPKFCLARLNPDGSLDSTFDGPSGGGNGKFLLPIGAATARAIAYSLALQPDGKIVVAGECSNGTDSDFCLARLHADGSFDDSFDGPSGSGNGKVLLSIGSNAAVARSVVLQPDGKIVVGGFCSNGVNGTFCVARLLANGKLDASFDGPHAATSPGNGKFQFSIGLGDSQALALALQPDGRIVMAGSCENSAALRIFCLARLNTDGSLDTSFVGPFFSGDGRFFVPVGAANDVGRQLALQPDGKIVMGGDCELSPGSAFCIIRLNANGTLDTSFDGPSGAGNGKIILPPVIASTPPIELPYALLLQPDGKIIMAGWCLNFDNEFCLVRLNGDGSLDSTFDGSSSGNGKFSISIGSASDQAYATALQPDGKILIAGSCDSPTSGAFCIARLNGGPYGAKHCTFDVDGDGAVLATTDLLIVTRVALGMRGDAVLGGITFAPYARRTSWTDIRNYLVTQCGMTIAP
jgi:uncharacterized delta-60 repeat protein